jgi:hypothetical protein
MTREQRPTASRLDSLTAGARAASRRACRRLARPNPQMALGAPHGSREVATLSGSFV